MLLSTGERIACALVAMAIHDLGEEAVSLHGLAGRDPHRLRAHEGEDPRDPRRPRPGRARRRARSCSSPASRASRATRWRSRRSAAAAPTPPPSRSPPRSAPPARSTRTCPASSPPTRGSSRTRASCRRRLLRRDARDGGLRREGADAPLGRARTQSRGSYSCALDVLGRGGNLGARNEGWSSRSSRPSPTRETDVVFTLTGIPDRPGVAALIFDVVAGGAGQRRHDHPERRPRAGGDVVLGARRGRARRRRARSRRRRTSSAPSPSRRTTSSARCR